MAETNWTPGPWRVGWGPDGGGHKASLQVTGSGRGVCGWWDYDNTTRANAALIAAAPDLYEALAAVVAVADRATVEFDAARAALSRARGEAATSGVPSGSRGPVEENDE